MKRTTLITIILLLSLTISNPVFAQTKIDFVYAIPTQNALYVHPQTTITINSPEKIKESDALAAFFTVTGTQSGDHSGNVVLSDDQQSIIFKPDQVFAYGEVVSVTLKPGIATVSGSILNGLSLHFAIQKSKVVQNPSEQNSLESEGTFNVGAGPVPTVKSGLAANQYHTIPPGFPEINITVPASGTGEGYLFFSNYSFGGAQNLSNNLLIVDDQGEPVFYYRLPAGIYAVNFKQQPNGWMTYWDSSVGGFRVMDSSYNIIDTIFAQNGYTIDGHEFLVLPNGHILLMSYDPETVDMTAYGGLADATVTGLIIQELDPQKNVVFQWRSWDHLDQIPFTDSNIDLTGASIDYIHGNAMAIDWDGNLLVSARHVSEVFKVNRINGDIMWIMGGKGNQFDFGTDEGFSYQHDIRRLANGDITIFDNNNLGLPPHYSRVVEYQIDEYYKTATEVWQFRTTPDTYSFAMGDAQRLPNGNTVIGWGSANPPTITEVKPDGSIALELALGNGQISYRAFRFPWVGHPTTLPDLVIDINGVNPALYYSWNGATDIKSYKVYGGVTSDSMGLLTETPKTGFETSTDITSWVNTDCYFQIMPIDNNDNETQFSRVVFNPSPACNPSFVYFPIITGNP